MQHDLPTKINLKSLTDLADKGNPAVLLFWDFIEAPAFVLWIFNVLSHAGKDGNSPNTSKMVEELTERA